MKSTQEEYQEISDLWIEAVKFQQKMGNSYVFQTRDKANILSKVRSIKSKNQSIFSLIKQIGTFLDEKKTVPIEKFHRDIIAWINSATVQDMIEKHSKTKTKEVENIGGINIDKKNIISFLNSKHPKVLREFVLDEILKSADKIADNFIKTI